MKLRGVFPVLPTPFTREGAPDLPALGRLVDFAIEAGADGIVYPGMASEVETLSPAERHAAVVAVGERLARRRPFVVGASDPDPARAAARAEDAARLRRHHHRRDGDAHAQAEFYRAVAGATALPLMLQNAPPPNGAGLKPEAVAAILANVPAIRWVKEETQPSGQNVTAILAAAGARLDGVFGGAGARFVMDELARGAAGLMPAAELTDVHAALYAAFTSGDAARARHLYSRSLPLLLFQSVFRVHATKRVLAARGLLDEVGCRAAGPRPDVADDQEIAALIAEAADLFTLHQVRA